MNCVVYTEDMGREAIHINISLLIYSDSDNNYVRINNEGIKIKIFRKLINKLGLSCAKLRFS